MRLFNLHRGRTDLSAGFVILRHDLTFIRTAGLSAACAEDRAKSVGSIVDVHRERIVVAILCQHVTHRHRSLLRIIVRAAFLHRVLERRFTLNANIVKLSRKLQRRSTRHSEGAAIAASLLVRIGH